MRYPFASVSYTHLDVYKRQVYEQAKFNASMYPNAIMAEHGWWFLERPNPRPRIPW